MPHAQEYLFSREPNTAGAPLPLIPRRASHHPRSDVHDARDAVVKTLSVPTRQRHSSRRSSDSESSNSSSDSVGRSPISLRAKRERGVRPAMQSTVSSPVPFPSTQRDSPHDAYCQPASNPVPWKAARTACQPHPMIYSPGMSLKMCVDSIKSWNMSEPHSRSELPTGGSLPTSSRSTDENPPLIRKKSGQLVKPSLKPTKPAKGNLTVITVPSASKSEPVTPTLSKAVHFDANLERVKLFLAEQKPLAVSRDGSPTDDTSGTDSDFPSFIYGDSDRRSKKKLVMRLKNMPARINLHANVVLEELTLSSDGTNILGRVRVRNIAYTKCVAVRFTFDSWQTTSEVMGRYSESIDTLFDRFVFSIKLNDLLPRIEGKTLLLAVRYSVSGQEHWDNNVYQNYCAIFSKTKLEKAPVSVKKGVDNSPGSNIDTLRSELERVMKGKEQTDMPLKGGQFAAPLTSRETDPPCFKSRASLASCGDFSPSLHNSPRNTFDVPPLHSRTQSYPQVAPLASPPSLRWYDRTALPKLETSFCPVRPTITVLGSPRDLGDDFLHVPRVASDLDGKPFTLSLNERHHQRSCFDLDPLRALGVRKTPPGSPPTSSFDDMSAKGPSRYQTFPFSDCTQLVPPPVSVSPQTRSVTESSGESELSTPPIITPTGSRSTTPSPTETEAFLQVLPIENKDRNSDYRQFLDRFCFFTGPQHVVALPEIPRGPVHDRDGAKDKISMSNSPLDTLPSQLSGNGDEHESPLASGTSTPTLCSVDIEQERSPTPVL